MHHYRKGENIEIDFTKDDLPFQDFITDAQKNFLWMHVKGGSKVANLISYAFTALQSGEYRHIVWSGSGGGVVKTVSCAEIMKRQNAQLSQVTRIGFKTVKEHWEPIMKGLDELVVRRQIPSIHIFMTVDQIPDGVSGLQKPNTKTTFWDNSSNKRNQKQRNHRQKNSSTSR